MVVRVMGVVVPTALNQYSGGRDVLSRRTWGPTRAIRRFFKVARLFVGFVDDVRQYILVVDLRKKGFHARPLKAL